MNKVSAIFWSCLFLGACGGGSSSTSINEEVSECAELQFISNTEFESITNLCSFDINALLLTVDRSFGPFLIRENDEVSLEGLNSQFENDPPQFAKACRTPFVPRRISDIAIICQQP